MSWSVDLALKMQSQNIEHMRYKHCECSPGRRQVLLWDYGECRIRCFWNLTHTYGLQVEILAFCCFDFFFSFLKCASLSLTTWTWRRENATLNPTAVNQYYNLKTAILHNEYFWDVRNMLLKMHLYFYLKQTGDFLWYCYIYVGYPRINSINH